MINLPLKTEPFLSYRNRLECVSPLLLAETHKLFSLQTLGIYCFSHVKNVHFQAREWISGNFRQEIPGWLSWSSSPQSLVRRPAAAAALSENLLETQIPGLHPRPTESQTLRGGAQPKLLNHRPWAALITLLVRCQIRRDHMITDVWHI